MKKKKRGGEKLRGIKVGFHQGNIIRYIADAYGTVMQVVLEVVQNMLDKRAVAALIELDLVNRTLTTFDNGDGASKPEMRERIGNIGKHLKRLDDIGGKGIGNLSAIGILGPGGKYRLTTHPKSTAQGYTTYVMDYDMTDEAEVEFGELDQPAGFRLEHRGEVVKAMTTSVLVTNIQPSAILELERAENPAIALADRLSETYSKRFATEPKKTYIVRVIGADRDGTKVWERVVEPQRFPGTKKIFSENCGEFGTVVFETFFTEKRVKTPRFFVDHQGKFTFPARNLEVWSLLKHVFGSGYVQGVVHVPFGELTASRKTFRPSPETTALYYAMIEVASQIDEILKQVHQEEKMCRYTAIVGNVLDRLKPIFDRMPELLSSEFKGAVAKGRPPVDSHAVVKRTASGRGGSRRRRDSGEIVRRAVRREPGAHIGHGPAGRFKMSHRCGITVILEEADPASDLGTAWRVRVGTEKEEKGAVIINISHADWKAAKGGKKVNTAALDTYVSMLIAEVLSAEGMPKDHGRIFRTEFEEVFLEFQSLFVPRIPQQGSIYWEGEEDE